MVYCDTGGQKKKEVRGHDGFNLLQTKTDPTRHSNPGQRAGGEAQQAQRPTRQADQTPEKPRPHRKKAWPSRGKGNGSGKLSRQRKGGPAKTKNTEPPRPREVNRHPKVRRGKNAKGLSARKKASTNHESEKEEREKALLGMKWTEGMRKKYHRGRTPCY